MMLEALREYRETDTARIRRTLVIDGALLMDSQVEALPLEVSYDAWAADGGTLVMRAAEGGAWIEIPGRDVLCLLNFLVEEGLEFTLGIPMASGELPDPTPGRAE